MNKTITLAQLKSLKSCGFEDETEQVGLFKELFGNKVKLTEELCIKHSGDFDFDWAANELFTDSVWAEYEKVRAPALAEYKKVTAPALAEYEKVRAPALAEYEKVRAPAWAEYEKVTASALAEYKKVAAITFYRLYNGNS